MTIVSGAGGRFPRLLCGRTALYWCREAIRSAAAGAMALRERWQIGVSYNPLSARTAQDPYPVLRARAPVHRSTLLNAWLLMRHADVDSILRDHRHFGNDPRKGTLSSRQLAMLPPSYEFTMLFLDPPDLTRLRALVNKAFARRAVNALETGLYRGTQAELGIPGSPDDTITRCRLDFLS